jgi:hypothetical protein
VATARDLGQDEPWQESVERSLARRTPPRADSDSGGSRQDPQRTDRSRKSRRRFARFGILAVSATASVLALLAALSPGLLDGGGALPSQGGALPFQTAARIAQLGSSYPAPRQLSLPGLGAASAARSRRCRFAAQTSGYVNPLVEAKVIRERIDQGVDYAGTGTLIAIGAAKVTSVSPSAIGWPGAFIEYRLSSGADRGCYVYYAEGVNPVRGLHRGQSVNAGQAIAKLIPGWSTGIEIGWGSGKNEETYAAATGKWNPTDDADNTPTAAGKSFSALIKVLGGPPGKNEG